MDEVKVPGLGRKVSRIGFGCWGIGGHGYGPVDDSDSVKAVNLALDLGINLFDTANVYGFGHSERILGRSLRGRWHEAVVCSKFGMDWNDAGETWKDSSPGGARQAIEGSLRRLGTDVIDLYLVHWKDSATPLEATIETLRRLREEGKIIAFGLSNVRRKEFSETIEAYELSALQLAFGLADRGNGPFLATASRKGLLTMAYGAVGRGVLSGEYTENHRFPPNDTRSDDPNFRGERLRKRLELVRCLADVGSGYGRSPAEVALRWVLDTSFTSAVIVGMTRANQVLTNSTLSEWSLSDDDFRTLEKCGNVS